MKTTRLIHLLLFAFALLAAGCSTVEPGKRYGSAQLESMKSAYIILAPSTDHKLAEYIQEALTSRNVLVTTGMPEKKPTDVSFYVSYEDHWKWDMAMYLETLDIRLLDPATGQIFASGAFRQGWFHSFPNPRLKTIEVVESIYRAK